MWNDGRCLSYFFLEVLLVTFTVVEGLFFTVVLLTNLPVLAL
jgi:hypothetical protein